MTRNQEVMTPGERDILREEARYLHRSMFRRSSPDDLVETYVRAHAEIPDLRAIEERQRRTVQFIVGRGLDAVSIEPWLRGKGMRHALSVKILLLAYLAECDTRHLEFIRLRSDGRWVLASMGFTMLIAFSRLLRGYIQKAWHGLV